MNWSFSKVVEVGWDNLLSNHRNVYQMQYIWKRKDIEDITWPLGDTKFLFECWKIFHEWNIFSTREEKFRISKRPCNVLFIIWTPMKYQTIYILVSWERMNRSSFLFIRFRVVATDSYWSSLWYKGPHFPKFVALSLKTCKAAADPKTSLPHSIPESG